MTKATTAETVILGIRCLCCTVLLGLVIPKFDEFFRTFDIPLPWLACAMVDVSRAFLWAPALSAGVFALAFVILARMGKAANHLASGFLLGFMFLGVIGILMPIIHPCPCGFP